MAEILVMQRIIDELRKRQDYYVILSDEEYVESEFLKNSNRKHLGKLIHCVDPDTRISVVEIYFKKDGIAIPLSKKEIVDFQTKINTERKTMKPGSKSQYTSLRLKRNSETELINDTVALVMEIFNYAHGIARNIHDPMLPKWIIKDGEEYIVVCGRCGEHFRRANRCTFCGQVLQWPKEEDISHYIDMTIID